MANYKDLEVKISPKGMKLYQALKEDDEERGWDFDIIVGQGLEIFLEKQAAHYPTSEKIQKALRETLSQ